MAADVMAAESWLPERVVAFLGEIPRGELRWVVADLGLGGRGRDGDPDPVPVGSGAVPRFAVRHVALEAALWEGGREPPTAAELADEAGLELSTVDRALEALGARLAGRYGS